MWRNLFMSTAIVLLTLPRSHGVEIASTNTVSVTLDAMNCYWSKTSQMIAQTEITKTNSYDLVHALHQMVEHYLDMDEYFDKISESFPEAIECTNSRMCLTVGDLIDIHHLDARQRTLPGEHTLLTNLYVAISRESLMYCRQVPTTDAKLVAMGPKCAEALERSAEFFDVEAGNVTSLAANKIYIVGADKRQLQFIPVSGEGVDGRFLINHGAVSLMGNKLKAVLANEIREVMQSILPFIEKVAPTKTPVNCNKYLTWALCRHYGLDCTRPLNDTALQMIQRTCTTSFPNMKIRDKRNLFGYLFTDQYNTLLSVLGSTRQNSRNIQKLGGSLMQVSRYLNYFSDSVEYSFNVTYQRMSHAYNELRLNQYLVSLDAEKTMLLNSIYTRHNHLQLIRNNHRHRLESIIEHLRPISKSNSHSCDVSTTGEIACQQGSSYLLDQQETQLAGHIRLRSHAHVMKMDEMWFAECLDKSPGQIFVGNQRGFVVSPTHIQSGNLTVPRQCFSHFTGTAELDCGQYVVDKKDAAQPQKLLATQPLQYVLTPTHIHLQMPGSSKITVITNNNTYIEVGRVVMAIDRTQFPLVMHNTQITWQQLLDRPDAPNLENFLMRVPDPRRLIGMLRTGTTAEYGAAYTWSKFKTNVVELYQTQPAVRYISWTMVSMASLGLIVLMGLGAFRLWKQRGYGLPCNQMEVESNAGDGRGQEAPESSNRKKAKGTRKRKLDSHEEITPLAGWTSPDVDQAIRHAAAERKLLFGEIDRITHFMKQLSDTGQHQWRSVHESIRKSETRATLLEDLKKAGFSDAEPQAC